MTSNVGIERTIADIAELADLMDVIKNQYPDTPAVLYKLAVEKSEKIVEDIHLLSSGLTRCTMDIPEQEQSAGTICDLGKEKISPPIEPGEMEVPDIVIPQIVDDVVATPVLNEDIAPVINEIIIEKIAIERSVTDTMIPLEELLQRRLAKDIKKAISLNDRFRFKRELFGNSDEVMDSTMMRLNDFESIQDVTTYLQQQFDWNPENEAVVDFMNILEKRFI